MEQTPVTRRARARRRRLALVAALAVAAPACGGAEEVGAPDVALTAMPAVDASPASEAAPPPDAPPSPAPATLAPAPTEEPGAPTEEAVPDVVPPASETTPLLGVGAYLVPTAGQPEIRINDEFAPDGCPILARVTEEEAWDVCIVVDEPGGRPFGLVVASQEGHRRPLLFVLPEDDESAWELVAAGPGFGPADPPSGYVSFTAASPRWTFATPGVILLEGLVGGSGAVAGYDVVTWSAGSEAIAIGHLEERAGARMEPTAGRLLVENTNHSDDAPNCCPTMHDFRLVDLAAWTVTEWSGVPIDEVVPEVVALRYYRHRIEGDPDLAAAYAVDAVNAMTWPIQGPDTALAHTPCPVEGQVLRCTLQNEAGASHLLVGEGGPHGWQVVEVQQTAD